MGVDQMLSGLSLSLDHQRPYSPVVVEGGGRGSGGMRGRKMV